MGYILEKNNPFLSTRGIKETNYAKFKPKHYEQRFVIVSLIVFGVLLP